VSDVALAEPRFCELLDLLVASETLLAALVLPFQFASAYRLEPFSPGLARSTVRLFKALEAGAELRQHPLQPLTDILEEVPAVGNLLCGGRPISGSTGVLG
jgi:hypothetical protein